MHSWLRRQLEGYNQRLKEVKELRDKMNNETSRGLTLQTQRLLLLPH